MPVYPRFRGRHRLHRFEDTGPGEVRRLLAVRRRLPGGLHPRRRRREHAREPRVSAGERYAAVYEINLVALHLLRLLRGRVPVRRDHDGPRLRDVRLQPLRPHLHQGDAARRAARAHAAARARASRSRRSWPRSSSSSPRIGAIAGAIGVVALRNPFYSVLALVVPPAVARRAVPAAARASSSPPRRSSSTRAR